MPKYAQFTALASSLGAIVVLSACGGDDAAKITPCPAGTAVGAQVVCICGDAATGAQICQDNMTLTDCVCGAGGATAGTGAGTGAGTSAAGTSSVGTTAGTGSVAGNGSSGDDSGTMEVADASVAADGGMVTKPTKPTQPPMDGTMLAACQSDNDCDGGRACYDASGATTVGYCTTVCNKDTDCASIGDGFACSTAGLPGTTRYCRRSCDGTSDKTCPKFMACTEVPPGNTFRCLYDAKDIGDGTAKVFQACKGSGDCAGDLVCYASNIALNNIGGMSYSGFCTQTCSKDNDCTENPKTGDVAPTCDNDGTCGLGCNSLLLGIGAPKCPDNMACIASGLLTNQCLVEGAATGGI